ncbi:DUF5405 family protein [Serratia marcescens]|uniref:DUF5405 family protein n=1 Tax=Serratia marcescens TaxID=615 RepID=UPI000651ED1D|nr:DUF5405 family protein [Serratia marcescens]AWC71338.1 hypothetical protein AM368_14510 [Serratia marcescens]AWC89305.1 hypothetical protein AM370_10240 [Serratia marcescens]AWS58490.1 hypothetical protein AM369_09405 [Serratia marcescens]AWS69869.1 hypothetical protein AM378_16280 [Serratia marcescens]EIY2713077.1 DUF5405 family protein [Serratia marcescens]
MANVVEVNGTFAIIKVEARDSRAEALILADVKTDKETKKKYYPTRAVYSNELKLISDLINLSVNRGVFLQSINSISDVIKESQRIAELGQQALIQLNTKSELH